MTNKNIITLDFFESWETHLAVDAMYFLAARQAHERAKGSIKNIQLAENRFAALDKEFSDTLSKHGGDSHSAAGELEPIGIQLSNTHDEIGLAYAPLIREVAVVHILSTSSLEAHINAIAKDLLKGKDLYYFQGLRLAAKWLFLPKMLGFLGFKTGQQPFQGFSKLLKFRNKLVHYKGSKEKWVYGAAPQFIKELGLTIQDSQESIESVENMISGLAQQRGIDAPYWLRNNLNDTIYFMTITE